MSETKTRELERALSSGDTGARTPLGAARIRAGLCPWCSKPNRQPGHNKCCCFACFMLRENRTAPNRLCHGCPNTCATPATGDPIRDRQEGE